VRAANPPWLVDVVPAYASVAVFFDARLIRYHEAERWLRGIKPEESAPPPGRKIVVPCCYEMGPDLPRVAEFTGRTLGEVIALHANREYTVFAVGFCPGFPYLGYLPDELAGVPRLESPRLRVEPGSVGLTGRQTGIYPLRRPGGWNLIGRTPMRLIDLAAGFFAFSPGDRVEFRPIHAEEFAREGPAG
jgi:inhibitor of KinA